MKKVRVLEIGTSGGMGGIESFIMNVCSRLDKNLFEFTLVADCDVASIEERFVLAGGKVIHIPSAVKNPVCYAIKLKRLLNDNEYDVIHIHKNSLNNPLALFFCSPKSSIILHSHNTQPANKKGSVLLHNIFKKKVARLPITRLACSKKAADWMFYDKQDVELIHNGIEIQDYSFNKTIRLEIRNKLRIEENCYAICALGRLTKQKNLFFLIDVFASINRSHPESKLFLVGTGNMASEVKAYAERSEFKDNIFFLGVRNDISRLLQGMDLLLMPSLYEGLPIAAVEAQAAGLPVLLSENIDHEVLMTDHIRMESIKQSPDVWGKYALELLSSTIRKDETANIRNAGYDIVDTVHRMEIIYQTLGGCLGQK